MRLKRTLSVIIVMAICLAQVSVVSAKEFNRELINGVVYIQAIVPINDNPKVIGDYLLKSGTGFFVGANKQEAEYIITSRSLIADFLKAGGTKGKGQLYVAFDKNDVEEVYYIDSDADRDIAILKLGKATDKRISLPLQVADEAYQGKPAYAIGFPNAASVDINFIERLSPGEAAVAGGNVSRFLLQNKTGVPLIQFDVNVNSTGAGGPLIDENGNVIGVCSPVSSSGSNINVAVNNSAVLQLLDKNSVPYLMGSQTPVLLYALVGVAAVAVIALVAILLLSGKNKKPAEKAKADVEKSSAPLKKAYLCSRTAQHPSLRMPLSANPVVIGRDQRVCKVIFKEGTAGISGKHCQLSFDSQTQNAVLIDLSSTYGTFLSSGQKLAPNVPNVLKQGDGFYLGEAANSFYIEMENV